MKDLFFFWVLETFYKEDRLGQNRQDGKAAATSHGSVPAGYILHQGRGEPAGKFVSLFVEHLIEEVSTY